MTMISIVAPIRNEMSNMPSFFDRVSRTMEAWQGASSHRRWELLACDDASTDGSRQFAVEFARTHPFVRALSTGRPSGQTGAFSLGFESARGDIIVTIDADLQVFPEDIPRLLRPLESGRWKVSNALRTRRKHTLAARFLSQVGNLGLKAFVNSPVTDAGSNFSAFPAKYVRHLPLVENDHRYLMPILAHRGIAPHEFVDVPVQHTTRNGGSSKYSSLHKAWTGPDELIRFKKRLIAGEYDAQNMSA